VVRTFCQDQAQDQDLVFFVQGASRPGLHHW